MLMQSRFMLDLTHLVPTSKTWRQTAVNNIHNSLFIMGIKEKAAEIRKKIEKIKRLLMDVTPLLLTQRTAKQNQIATLRAQILAL